MVSAGPARGSSTQLPSGLEPDYSRVESRGSQRPESPFPNGTAPTYNHPTRPDSAKSTAMATSSCECVCGNTRLSTGAQLVGGQGSGTRDQGTKDQEPRTKLRLTPGKRHQRQQRWKINDGCHQELARG